MSKKLLVICGPTATGKTSLALSLSQKFRGEVVSFDSRQVYRTMDIGTGKNLPGNAKWKVDKKKRGYYACGDLRIWGYDLVGPKENFSVGDFIKYAEEVVGDVWERNKLPILTGGTGFYIKSLLDGVQTIGVKKNKYLRGSIKEKTETELFEILAKNNPVKAASMNISDRKNRRRLVRAIEITDWERRGEIDDGWGGLKCEVKFIGLRASVEFLSQRVNQSIKKRIKKGFEKELGSLLERGVGWDHQSMQALGYKQFKGYLSGDISYDQAIEEWESAERQYVKRQLTWFKKNKEINWFDISKISWRKDVEKRVKEWYKEAR